MLSFNEEMIRELEDVEMVSEHEASMDSGLVGDDSVKMEEENGCVHSSKEVIEPTMDGQ